MRLAWWVGGALTVASLGCGPKVPFDEDTDSFDDGSGTLDTVTAGSTTAQTTFDSTTTATTVPTATVGTSTPTATDPTFTTSGPLPTTVGPTDTGSSSVTTFPTATFTVTSVTGPMSTGPTDGGAPNGAPCDSEFDCASGYCYDAGLLGGVCGECSSDADCPGGGCSPPNPIDGSWSECNMGGFGESCDTNAACVSPYLCAEILDIPGVLTEATCSECQFDTDCMGLCSPFYDIQNFSGFWFCTDPASLSNGNGCNLFGSGDQVCISGHCAAANVMGLVSLGVCSGCETDDDCPPNSTCFPPQVDFQNGLVPGFCG